MLRRNSPVVKFLESFLRPGESLLILPCYRWCLRVRLLSQHVACLSVMWKYKELFQVRAGHWPHAHSRTHARNSFDGSFSGVPGLACAVKTKEKTLKLVNVYLSHNVIYELLAYDDVVQIPTPHWLSPCKLSMPSSGIVMQETKSRGGGQFALAFPLKILEDS